MTKHNCLSELFLTSLSSKPNEESLKQALLICNDEFLHRTDFLKPTMQARLELKDFLDVYAEFDHELPQDFKTSLALLQIINKLDLCRESERITKYLKIEKLML